MTGRPRVAEPMRSHSFALPDSLVAEIAKRAAKEKISMSAWVRRALEQAKGKR